MYLRRRLLQSLICIQRSKSTSPKVKEKFNFKLTEDVEELCKTGQIKARKHSGTFSVGTVQLPLELTEAAINVLKEFPEKSLISDSKKLLKYIWSRHPPLEQDELKIKVKDAEDFVRDTADIDPSLPYLDEKTRKRLIDSQKSHIQMKLKNEVYNWKPIEYNEYRAALYLTGRMAADYASLYRILSEIKKRDPKFSPYTMFDFGSGVGSSMWAVDSIWPGACKEAVCVDSSSEMNDMADKLQRGGDVNSPLKSREGGTFYKQFLPMSSSLKYDVVLSSRSLFELPNMETRLRTIDVLWKKTKGYLVIVELGTNAGYRLIQEARDYVLELSQQDRDGEEISGVHGHVFSPCPHDQFCPRFFDGTNTPCNFEVTFKPFKFGKEVKLERDLFTYVVLKKGKRNEFQDEAWPRVVRSPIHPTKHVICRTCTKYGKLQEFTITKRRHGKECYQVAKNTKWGDLLPIDSPEPPHLEPHLDNVGDNENTGQA